jgi:hypothetical protein
MKRIAKVNAVGIEKNKEYTITEDIEFPEYYSTSCGIDFLKSNLDRYFFVPPQNSIKAKINTPNHYDNSKGSLYQFAEQQGLNAWEFEIIKRIVRCRKKGEFISDIKKTIDVLNIYLSEQGDKYKGQNEILNK